MQVWRGWTVPTPTMRALSWSEWCARQQGTLGDVQCRKQGVPFSEQQQARLAFLRWLYQTGRLDPREYDND